MTPMLDDSGRLTGDTKTSPHQHASSALSIARRRERAPLSVASTEYLVTLGRGWPTVYRYTVENSIYVDTIQAKVDPWPPSRTVTDFACPWPQVGAVGVGHCHVRCAD